MVPKELEYLINGLGFGATKRDAYLYKFAKTSKKRGANIDTNCCSTQKAGIY